ncbi:diaminopimelate dehydrogenase [Aerococcus urinaehominis]|uniref:Meso-diaminopimelate D-dehydrogenase n=1 Tax=Aerococcus urinaehominis TaxID=128944 RepID=A0A0X8FJM2_9LACT|nr:diaminopimelate dehydrogenase [Aerococcus urinaehominis]AMB98551.1 diaminopimelate dehydrogenase [Aerococcus urinaehominis]SDL78379.1 diaminopimelate dehydrogenase [Aerococcus urinaehominis]
MIKVGIVGYGNLGRGVEANLKLANDMELVGIFSRRDPASLDTQAPAYYYDDLDQFTDKIDVLILCGGSRTDIPKQGPELAQKFNTVDAYDNHSNMSHYYQDMQAATQAGNKLAIIATGWDPGLFSLNRLMGAAILPQGNTYTFWGKGLSQGHGDAVRGVDGVADAVQYTIPNQDLMADIREGKEVAYDSHSAHKREVYAVLADGADPDQVREAIVTMPDYFQGYETTVHFISAEELKANHQGLPHGGHVIRSGQTSPEAHQVYEFSLDLASNPEFTAAVNVAYARAAARLAKEGVTGVQTVFDVAPKYLSSRPIAELIADLL